MGEVVQRVNLALPDLDRRERLLLGTLAAAVVLGGPLPHLRFGPISGAWSV